MHDRLITQGLGFAGLLPFYAAVLGFAYLVDYPQSLSVQGFIIYSLAILCFLSGALWGQATQTVGREQILRRVISNGMVIFAVAAVLTAHAMLAAFLLMLGYLGLLWYERRLGDTEQWYGRLRFQLTVGVVIAHLLYVWLHVKAG
ncbi:MAG: DUF3429 domain-containing protein [Halieaceae bacterium]